MRRVSTSLALALCLLGCDSAIPPWDRVELLTSSGNIVGCYLSGPSGELVVDEKAGTALKTALGIIPVKWPPGFTGRRVGREVVEVLDPDLNLVAVTGLTYEILPAAGFGYVPGEVLVACDRR